MVYFISDGTYTKIGKSKNPLSRIKGLQTSNAKGLTFKYVFDCGDQYEKKLHSLLKNFKTESSNEWFDLRGVKLWETFKELTHNSFKDVARAEHKAMLLNNEFYRSDIYDHEKRSQIVNKIYKTNKKNGYVKENRKKIIDDVIHILEYEKNKVISYNQYVIKYGFTKNEISFFMRSCKLNKAIADHNKRIFRD